MFLQPDPLSPVILVLETAFEAPVVGRIGEWYQILVPTEERGVVRIGYVRLVQAGEFVPAPPRTITAEEWYPLGVPESQQVLSPDQIAEAELLVARDWREDRFDVGVRLGFLSLTAEAVKHNYGAGFLFGGDVLGWTESGFGGGVSVEYYDEKSVSPSDDRAVNPELEGTALRIVPVSANFLYRWMRGRFVPYVGGGPGFTYWELRREGVTSPNVAVVEPATNIAFSLFVVGGIQVRASSVWIFVEAKYRSDLATAVSPDLDVGGFNLLGGVRF